MSLKLQIVRGEEVIFEMPLSPNEWSREELLTELDDFQDDYHRFSRIYNALSNETRLMMMKRIMEKRNRTINFSDYMRELGLNPKLVWENTRKLRDSGFIVKVGRGRYRCSDFGETGFMMMSIVLRRIIDTLDEIDNQ
jgi:predicted transcriptional regulator